jgi:deoxyxylulose-5-phosphate synthase
VLGVPCDFIPQGSQAELLHALHLDGAGIAGSIRQAVAALEEEESEALGRPGS